jgi:hypothetical protein
LNKTDKAEATGTIIREKMSSNLKKNKKKKGTKKTAYNPGKVVEENPQKAKELIEALKVEHENNNLSELLKKGEWPYVYETAGMKKMEQHLLFPNKSKGARFIIERLDKGTVNVLADPVVGGEKGKVNFQGADMVVFLMGSSMNYILGEVYLTSSDIYHLWLQFENSKQTSAFEWPDYRACVLCPVCGTRAIPSLDNSNKKKYIAIRSMFLNISQNVPNIGTRFIERLVCMQCFDYVKDTADGGHPEQLYNPDIFALITNNAVNNNKKSINLPDFYTAINIFETFGLYGAIDKKSMELFQSATNGTDVDVDKSQGSKPASQNNGQVASSANLSNRECHVCKKSEVDIGKKLKNCARCKVTQYCSRECQLKDWKSGHKKLCSELYKR